MTIITMINDTERGIYVAVNDGPVRDAVTPRLHK